MGGVLLAATLCAAAGPQAPPHAAATHGLRWLAAHARGAGWRGKDPGTESSKRRFATAAAAYAALLLPPPGDDDAAPLRAAVADWTAELRGGRLDFAQVNWIDGIDALYCAEWSEREGHVHPRLGAIVAGFAERQNREGGWAHGTGLSTDFYPSTLVAATNLALLALGTAARLGLDVDPEAGERGLALLAAVQAPSGGFPYGGRDYRKGIEAGRTCGSLVALAAMQRQQDRGYASAASYVRANRARIPDGHASPALHVLFGALASHVLGKDDWRDFDAKVLARVRAAQRPDGSFADIVEGSPDSMRILGDELTNSAYLTALYTAALATPFSKVASRWQATSPALAARAPTPAPAPPAAAWSVEVPRVRALAVDGERLLVLTEEEGVHWLEAASGRTLARADMVVERTGSVAVACDDGALVVAAKEPSLQTVAGQVVAAAPTGSPIACFDAAGVLRWRASVPFAVADVRLVPGGACLLGVRGRCVVLDLVSGESVVDRDPLGIGVNVGWLVRDDCRVLTGEHRLVLMGRDGSETWSRRLRAPRGLTPPACCGLAITEGTLHVATTAGQVQRRRLADGEVIDEATLSSGPSALVTDGTTVIVLTEGGAVHGLRAGREAWQQDVALGAERQGAPVLMIAGDQVLAGDARSLTLLDTADGRRRCRWELAPTARCLVVGQHLVVLAPGGRADHLVGHRLRAR